MMAIVILGLGLLMVATMFPVAWTRARDLAEFTNQTTATEAARTTVDLLCHVSNPNTGATTSFLGDIQLPATSDGSVHVLHVENAFPTPNAGDALIWPEQLRDMGDASPPTGPTAADFIQVDPTSVAWFLAGPPPPSPPLAQIAFHERVIPPLPRRPDVPPALPAELAQWNQQLANRRFAWAVLYKLDAPLPVTGDEPRSITMFLVTLRRTQSTHRFARQDDQAPQLPTPPFVWTTQPTALGPADDMIFPLPWLVNLQVLGNWVVGSVPGIPSEAVANPGGAAPGRLIGRMLQPGSKLIDRLSGAVYTVKNHRFTGGAGAAFDNEATMTLDREITLADVDYDWDGPGVAVHPNGIVDLTAPTDEDNRDFWVFPPPVSREVADPAYPEFSGKQPVVGIETRQMIFNP